MSAIIHRADPFTPRGRTTPRLTVTIPHRATALVTGSLLLPVGIIGAAVKLHALATSLSAPTSLDAPGIAWAGWLLIIPALVAGQMWRGWMHSRGIRKSHFAAIAGKGLALALVVLAVVRIAGGAG